MSIHNIPFSIYIHKKRNYPKLSQICNCSKGHGAHLQSAIIEFCSKGPKNDFETVVVYEQSMLKPLLKFCCNYSFVPSTYELDHSKLGPTRSLLTNVIIAVTF